MKNTFMSLILISFFISTSSFATLNCDIALNHMEKLYSQAIRYKYDYIEIIKVKAKSDYLVQDILNDKRCVDLNPYYKGIGKILLALSPNYTPKAQSNVVFRTENTLSEINLNRNSVLKEFTNNIENIKNDTIPLRANTPSNLYLLNIAKDASETSIIKIEKDDENNVIINTVTQQGVSEEIKNILPFELNK